MREHLAALLTVQKYDSELDLIKHHFGALDTGAAASEAMKAARAAHKAAIEAVHSSSGDQKDAELEQKAIETKRGDYETKLYGGTITAPKELKAMQDEIEMLEKQRSKLDERILEIMEQAEAARLHEAESGAARKAAESHHRERVATYKKATAALSEHAQTAVAHRKAAAKSIPSELVARYDHLRTTKAGLGIVPLQDGNMCGGCKTGLPLSLVRKVKEGATVEVCDNCGRILCDPKWSI